MHKSKELSPNERESLFITLESRFHKHMNRHPEITWEKVKERLERHTDSLWSLFEMEKTGGEPDVMSEDKQSGEIVFVDFSPESPEGRRNCCYDNEALEARKKFKPKDSARNMAKDMGIDLLTEEEYQKLQELGEFDTKTSSWVKTPQDVRALGGAIFCDRRFNRVFTYHNGADSYYSSRGFRGVVRI